MPAAKMGFQASLEDQEQRESQAVQATQVTMEIQVKRVTVENQADLDLQGMRYSYC